MVEIALHRPNADRALSALVEERARLKRERPHACFGTRAILTRDINQLAKALGVPMPERP